MKLHALQISYMHGQCDSKIPRVSCEIFLGGKSFVSAGVIN